MLEQMIIDTDEVAGQVHTKLQSHEATRVCRAALHSHKGASCAHPPALRLTSGRQTSTNPGMSTRYAGSRIATLYCRGQVCAAIPLRDTRTRTIREPAAETVRWDE